MSKVEKVGVITLMSLGVLLGAAGVVAGIRDAVEADKEYKRIPGIREVIRQDYELHNITLSEYTVKMEELARKDAELPAMEGSFIIGSVISAIAAGGLTWAAIKTKDLL